MGVENWIDEIATLAGSIEAGGKGNVKSYWAFRKTDFPEAITVFPCALTYVTGVRVQGGSDSGPTICIWRGVTELHIVSGVSKVGIPEVLPYFERVLRAFVSKRTLGGKVASFGLIPEEEGEAIVHATLEYGGETGAKNRGLVVYWKVKEAIGDLVLGN